MAYHGDALNPAGWRERPANTRAERLHAVFPYALEKGFGSE